MDEVKGYLEYDGDIYKIQSVEQLQEFMDSLEDDTDEFDDFCNEDDYYNEWDDYGTSGEKYGVNVNLGANSAMDIGIGTEVGVDTISNIENVLGSKNTDSIADIVMMS